MGKASKERLRTKKIIAGLEQDAKELLAIRDANDIKHKAVIKQICLLQRILVDDQDETPEPETEQTDLKGHRL